MISSHYDLSDNCFSFTSTLTDAMRSMDVSRSSDSLISYPRFLYHMPPACVLVRFPFPLRVFSYLYEYGLSTRLRLLVCFTFPFESCQLVHLRFSLMSVSFYLVDSSPCLPLPLMLTCCSLTTHLSTCLLTRFPFTNICNCTR